MEHERIAKQLAQLGNTTRLSVVKLLVKAEPGGMAVGEIQKRLNIPASTLSHHISRLTRAKLVRQKRSGHTLRCFAALETIRELADFLLEECCTISDG